MAHMASIVTQLWGIEEQGSWCPPLKTLGMHLPILSGLNPCQEVFTASEWFNGTSAAAPVHCHERWAKKCHIPIDHRLFVLSIEVSPVLKKSVVSIAVENSVKAWVW